jgi:predicted nucleic acid-binding protein
MGTMSVYADANVLVALVTADSLSARALAFLRSHRPELVVSDFAAAEVASAIARRVRTGDTTAYQARLAFATFDAWIARVAARVEMVAADIAAAATYLRRLDLTLRTPDALHIALTQRLGCELLTFDARMAASARMLGARVAVE